MGRPRKKPYPDSLAAPPDNKCPICHEPHSPSIPLGQLVCGHNIFCLSCLQTWANTTNKCPLCSSRFRFILQCSFLEGVIIPSGEQISIVDCDPPHIETPTQAAIGNIRCNLCESGDHEEDMLLCDHCNDGFHTYCLRLKHVPNLEFWFCQRCIRVQNEDVRQKQRQEIKLVKMRRSKLNSTLSQTSASTNFAICDSLFDAIASGLRPEDLA